MASGVWWRWKYLSFCLAGSENHRFESAVSLKSQKQCLLRISIVSWLQRTRKPPLVMKEWIEVALQKAMNEEQIQKEDGIFLPIASLQQPILMHYMPFVLTVIRHFYYLIDIDPVFLDANRWNKGNIVIKRRCLDAAMNNLWKSRRILPINSRIFQWSKWWWTPLIIFLLWIAKPILIQRHGLINNTNGLKYVACEDQWARRINVILQMHLKLTASRCWDVTTNSSALRRNGDLNRGEEKLQKIWYLAQNEKEQTKQFYNFEKWFRKPIIWLNCWALTATTTVRAKSWNQLHGINDNSYVGTK